MPQAATCGSSATTTAATARRARSKGAGGLFIPGRWDRDTRYDERLEWQDGGYVRSYLRVDGTELFDTGLGRIRAWRAPNGSGNSENIVIEGADWWAPELGQPVQFDANTSLPDGGRVSLRAVLELNEHRPLSERLEPDWRHGVSGRPDRNPVGVRASGPSCPRARCAR